MIADHAIARWRLRTQRLVRPSAASAAAAVRSLLAVQAENPGQAAWAVACRTAEPSPADLAGALDDGRIIRTHVLRPTWHYVAAEDLGWLVDLTGPRVRRVTGQQLRDTHGQDDRAVERLTSLVMTALDAADLTRGRLADALAAQGARTDGSLLMILLAHLELAGLVCSGRPVAGVHTYAPTRRRVPASRRLERDEALAELAVRYFTGHGPATERDLAYWATLAVTDVRRGLRQVSERLACFEQGGRTFWHAPGEPPTGPQEPAGHLLQILDEMYRGYQDSRWVLDPSGEVPRGREAATGMALVDARLVAAMRRTVTGSAVRFALHPHHLLTAAERGALEQAATRYGDYLGLPAEVTVVPGNG